MTSWVVVSIFFLFSPRFGEDFSDGLKPPTRWRLYFCFAVKPYLWTNSRFLRKQYLSEQTPTFIYTVRPTNVLCGWISIIGDLPTQKKTPDNRHVPRPETSCSTRNSKARSPTAGTSFKAWLGQTSWEFEHLGEGWMLYFNSEAEKTSVSFLYEITRWGSLQLYSGVMGPL